MTGWLSIADAWESDLRAAALTPEDYVARHPGWPSTDHVLVWRLLRDRSMSGRDLALRVSWATRRWMRAVGLMLPAGGSRGHRQWTTVRCCRDVIAILDDVALVTGGLKSAADRWVGGMQAIPCDCPRCRGKRQRRS